MAQAPKTKARSPARARQAIGILFKSHDPASFRDLKSISQALLKSDPQLELLIEKAKSTTSAQWKHPRIRWLKADQIPPKVSLVLAIGGDGTILRAARLLLQKNEWESCQLLGIHSGTVGFLAALEMKEALQKLPRLLRSQKNLVPEARSCLHVQIHRKGRVFRNFHVLNDCVLSKGSLSRIFEFHVEVDSAFLSSYRADGLIVSPPTGSTAYNLAAGGAIVHHQIPAIQITPIAPQSLSNKPIILSDQHEICLRLGRHSTDVYLTMDGQKGLRMGDEDLVYIYKSEKSVEFLSLRDRQLEYYFKSLRQKLNWGLLPQGRT